MTKFYKRNRGRDEFYMVSDERCIRVINRYYVSEVSITHAGDEKGNPQGIDFMRSAAEEGKEISRDEFAEQLAEAQRLIVLE